LSQISSISCVSGGSIIGAWLARMIHLGQQGGTDGLHLEGDVYRNWNSLEDGFFAFVQRDARSVPILSRFEFWRWTLHRLQKHYDGWLGGMKLRDLPATPFFIFCATDLVYANCWACTKLGIGDYLAGYVTPPPESWTVGKAVAVSSCFPPVFA